VIPFIIWQDLWNGIIEIGEKPGFYLVGKLVLDKIIKKSDLENNPTLIPTVQNNAHVKRWLIEPKTEPKYPILNHVLHILLHA